MENAVRALYITAGVLIAVMVLSLAVLLFKEKKKEFKEITE